MIMITMYLLVWSAYVQCMSCLERIARSVGVSSLVDHKLSIDEATQLIIDQTHQLSDVTTSSRDQQQTLIHSLQHKLKSLKERLDFKVIHPVTLADPEAEKGGGMANAVAHSL